MIIGLGIDLIDIRRIERVISQYGHKFKNRIFTPAEIEKCDNRRLSLDSYAKRYAAKEACSKALGTGFRHGVYWKDIEVVNSKSGKPYIALHGGAMKKYMKLIPDGKAGNINLSMTDEYPYAQAMVVITLEG
tara:strand:+ start:7669 stop:8064 length:396 start_codon:yes stop_codon:yes gene_type:complete